jgi:hypothetical protein
MTLEELKAELATASAAYSKARGSGQTLLQQESAARALLAVHSYLSDMGLDPFPLLQIASALVDATEGVPDPLLAPRERERRGRPALPISEQRRHAAAAAAVSALIHFDSTEPDALHEVHRASGIAKSKIEGWRDKMHKKDSSTQAFYWSSLAQCKAKGLDGTRKMLRNWFPPDTA